MTTEPLLEIKRLTCTFRTPEGIARAVDDLSLSVGRGETVGVVGESGCGKTVTALAILRLLPEPYGRIERGEILYKGVDLVTLPIREMRKIRGNEISMIFQEPMTSLNPVFTCGYQIREAVLLHQKVKKKEAQVRTLDMLHLVGIPDPAGCAKSYPHQLSGGMRQRVMIAMALSCRPSLLIADEPTTALDVTIQAQILELLQKLQADLGMAVMMITHDFGVIAETTQRVVVMYAGQVVETGRVADVFHDPRHPYTIALQQSMPRKARKGQRLRAIPGRVPDPWSASKGCRFRDRCAFAEARCATEDSLRMVGPGHFVRCWKEISLEDAAREVGA